MIHVEKKNIESLNSFISSMELCINNKMHKLNNSIKKTKSFGFYKFLIIDFDINIKKYEKKLKIDCNSDLFLRYS